MVRRAFPIELLAAFSFVTLGLVGSGGIVYALTQAQERCEPEARPCFAGLDNALWLVFTLGLTVLGFVGLGLAGIWHGALGRPDGRRPGP